MCFCVLPLCLFVPDKAAFILAVQKLHCVKPLRVQNLHCVGLYSLGTLCKNCIAVSRYIVILRFHCTVQKLHLYTICCHTVPKIKVGSTNQSRSDNHSGFECSDRTWPSLWIWLFPILWCILVRFALWIPTISFWVPEAENFGFLLLHSLPLCKGILHQRLAIEKTC